MFEQTLSIWRRLVGWPPTAAAVALTEDCRLSVRFSTDLEVQYQPTRVDQECKFQYTARVRNVSAAGINLEVDRRFDPGELLNIRLPGGSDSAPTTVIACVVYAHEEIGQCWSLGCTFAQELTRQELAVFGSHESSKELPVEQRFQPRFGCEIGASYQTLTEEQAEPRPAKVLNIATTGVGLLVEQPIRPGELLNVELNNVENENGKDLLCCAVHISEQDDGAWIIGCNFINEITEEDLNSLLR